MPPLLAWHLLNIYSENSLIPPSPPRQGPMRRYIIIATALLAPGYFALDRADRAIDRLARANAELVKANAHLSAVNRQIEEMQARLADTSRKLDQTNANLALTNDKFDETNDRFVALDRVFQKFPLWRK